METTAEQIADFRKYMEEHKDQKCTKKEPNPIEFRSYKVSMRFCFVNQL